MANTRKAGRSNTTQNLDNAKPEMDQNLDQDTQSNDMKDRGTQNVGGNQSQQQSGMQNDSNIGADTALNNKGGRGQS